MKLVRLLKTLLISLILISGLLTLIARLGSPIVASLKPQITQAFSKQLEAPVQIGGIETQWQGLTPSLSLYDLSIGEQGNQLAFDKAELDISLADLYESSWQDSLILAIDGLNLNIIRDIHGKIQITGLNGSDTPLKQSDKSENKQKLVPLPHHMRFTNATITWHDQRIDGPTITLNKINLRTDRANGALNVYAQLDTEEGEAFFQAKLYGHIREGSWQGESYLKLSNINLAELAAPYIDDQYNLTSLRLNMESWGLWQDARAVQFDGHADISDLAFADTKHQSLTLDALNGDFLFRRQHDGWRGEIQQLNIRTPATTWPETYAAFHLQQTNLNEQQVKLKFGHLHLRDLLKAAQSISDDTTVNELLEKTAPIGVLNDTFITLNNAEKWKAHGRYQKIGFNPDDYIPGLQNLSGKFHIDANNAVFKIDAKDVVLDADYLYEGTRTFSDLEGIVHWKTLANGWHAYTNKLSARINGADTTTRFELREEKGKRGILELQSDISPLTVAQSKPLQPRNFMDAEDVAWLDESVISGTGSDTQILFSGPYDDFPFNESRTGQFEVVVKVNDGLFAGQSGFPDISAIQGEVYVQGERIEVSADSAQMLSSNILNTKVSNYPIGSGLLEIDGRLSGPLSDVFELLQRGELKERFHSLTQQVSAKGNSKLALQLAIPLDEESPLEIESKGSLQLLNNTLRIKESQLDITRLRGKLHLNGDAVSAKGIKAKVWNKPITIDAKPRGKNNTELIVHADISAKDIKQQAPGLPDTLINGKTKAELFFAIPHTQPEALSLRVSSDLKGLSINLPKPFGKTANTSKDLRLQIPLGDKRLHHSLSLGNNISAMFSHDWQRGDIAIGQTLTPHSLPKKGFHVHGSLNTVNLNELNNLAGQQSSNSNRIDFTSRLRIASVIAGERQLGAVNLAIASNDKGWHGNVSTTDINGSFQIPLDMESDTIKVDIDEIDLSFDTKKNTIKKHPAKSSQDGPDPRSLPSLDVTVKKVKINQASLGTFILSTKKMEGGQYIKQATLTGGLVSLDSRGYWVVENGKQQTTILGGMHVGDFGVLLEKLGYGQPMEQAPGNFALRADWPGNPLQLSLSSLSADTEIHLGKGKLLDVSPGVGRLTGLLSLGALTRRLRLDFSDVFDKGLTFDKVQGSLQLAEGQARTEDLELDGPSARIAFKGRVGLIDEDIDQHLVVYPNLDGTLSLAGTLISGPAAGVAILIAQKVLHKETDDFNRFEYDIKGSWQEPEVKQLDSGGFISKLLKPFSDTGENPIENESDPSDGIDFFEDENL